VFGVDPEKGTFEFFGPKEKREPFTGVRESVDTIQVTCRHSADIFQNSVAKYTVASVLLLNSIPVPRHHAAHFATPPRHIAGKKS
jgi:hypothetical protein